GIRWTPGQFDQLRSRLVLTKGVTKLTEDLVISGTIPNEEAYPPTEQFYTKGENDSLSVDPMEHEQFLVVRQRKEDGTSKGIYIFSGCSHKGVVPILHYAKTLFPGEKICGLIGGLHLYNASKEVRQKVIQEVLDANIEWVMPVHCTGIEAICELKSKLGEQCRVVGAGDSFEF
ncbi:MAG: MBL fold metallo-hydrolase, partial [Anaerovorax sp.]